VVNVEYFIVSVVALVIATYLIFIIANKIFNINLRIKPLLLCACCSLFISTALPQLVIGYAGITGTIAALVICAILFSYFIVYHSDSEKVAEAAIKLTTLTSKQKPPNVDISQLEATFPVIEEVIPMQQTAVHPPQSILDKSKQHSAEKESLILEYNSDEIEAETWTEILLEQSGSAIFPEECKLGQPIKAELQPVLDEDRTCKQASELNLESEPIFESALPSHLVTELETESIITVAPKEDEQEQSIGAKLELEPAPVFESALPSYQKAELETKPELVLQQLETIQSQPLMLTMPLQVKPAVDNQQQVNDDLPESEQMLTDINSLESLDDLLDYAFTQKNALQLTWALKAFKKALSLCKESDVAPLIIIEIGNIFKARGQYDEAVQLFSEGRSLPYLRDNSALNQQFIEMIAFLRIIKNNLLENQGVFVPYDKIPSDVMLKINEEFRDWLTLSCAKPQIGRIIEE
jgi:tetratricopeptide (TPR) repeat protein